MEPIFYIQTVIAVFAFAGLLAAAYCDWRSREVPDMLWICLGAGGIAALFAQSLFAGNLDIGHMAALLVCAVFFIAVVCASEKIILVVAGLATAVSFMLLHADLSAYLHSCLSVFQTDVFLALYWIGAIRGGADVKCLISISMCVPAYPHWCAPAENIPDIAMLVFSPSVTVLFIGALLAVTGCAVYCLAHNCRSGDARNCRIGEYTLPIDAARRSFVWPSEDVVGGRKVRIGIPGEDEVPAIWDRLCEHGDEKAKVTPMIPFIVPLAAAFLCTMLFGNLMFTVLC